MVNRSLSTCRVKVGHVCVLNHGIMSHRSCIITFVRVLETANVSAMEMTTSYLAVLRQQQRHNPYEILSFQLGG